MTRRRGSLGAVALKSVALTGIAIAVPLLTLLGSAETFFTAHGAEGSTVILYGVVIVLAPALLVFTLLALAHRFAPPVVVDVLIGLLVSAVVVPIVGRGLRLTSAWYIGIAVFVTIIAAVGHARTARFGHFIGLTAIGPIVVLGWFLLLSSTATLVLPAQATGHARAARASDVMLVVFDELPLAALMDAKGSIDEDRFPNFAALAGDATWYRNATTVSAWTHLAVPALFSGRAPVIDATARTYANNVFSMLAASHRLVPMEAVTNLCRERTCGERPTDVGTLVDDSWIIYGHTFLPKDVAERTLPPVEDRWSNFRSVLPDRELLVSKDERGSDEAHRFSRLLASIERADDRPTAWIAHFKLPHLPLSYLPDGRSYDIRLPPGLSHGRWTDTSAATDARQRFVLQVRYVDALLGDLIETLRSSDRYDRTMIVIASDHGISFRRGHRRGVPYSERTAADVLPVPLFIKYPGQQRGRVDSRSAQVIDVVPTIADALDVDLPFGWDFDGVSLATDRKRASPRRYVDGEVTVAPARTIDMYRAVRDYRRLFGAWRGKDDTFAWGPHHALVGRRTRDLDVGTADARARLYEPERYTDVDADSEPLPLLVRASVSGGIDAGEWIALGMNGRIAGLALAYEIEQGTRITVVASPRFLHNGDNDVELYRVTDDGDLERIRT